MNDNQKSEVQQSEIINPPGPATWIGHFWRNKISKILTCLLNPKITIKWLAADGVSTLTRDADITMSEHGWRATIALNYGDFTAGGGSGSTASVQQYTFVSDRGDFFMATPTTSVAVSTTLSSPFSNSSSVTTLSVTSAIGIAAGQSISGTGVPSGVIVVSVSGATVTTSGFTSTAGSSGSYTFGTNVAIAKPPKLWCSITGDTQIDGSGAHTYTYNSITVGGVIVAYTRTNTWNSGANTQTEDITPAYLVGDLLYAIGMPVVNMPITVGSGTTVAVALLDIHDKDWAI